MPVFEQRLAIIARGMRAFLNLEAGVTRGAAPEPPQADQSRELEQALQELASKDQELAELRARMVRSGTGAGAGSIRPENMVWIFGDGRSGSTWLMSMMSELKGHALWKEPMVGLLFGYLYYAWADEKRYKTKHFIMGLHRENWLRSVRNFVLDGAKTVHPELPEDEYLVIKEPNGSIGAPLMMEALPESRMILLVRDPRDVVASSMDGHREGSWHYIRRSLQHSLADEDPDIFVENRANKYLWFVGNAKRAYEAHEGPKILVRYEDLREDTLGTMKRIYSTLGVPVDEEELARAVEKHSWENIPEEDKGEGKFHRRATPGGWGEDLTPGQAETVERITAPLLKEFYSYEGQSEHSSERLPLDWFSKNRVFYA